MSIQSRFTGLGWFSQCHENVCDLLSGYCTEGIVVTLKSKKQSVVARSSAEPKEVGVQSYSATSM